MGSVELKGKLYNIIESRTKEIIEQIENTREIAGELGIPFSDRSSMGLDDDDELNMYTYDGSMSPGDFRKMQLLNSLSQMTGKDDDTPFRLIEAFEAGSEEEIKEAISEILVSDELTDRVFDMIAEEYDEIRGSSDEQDNSLESDNVSFSEQIDQVLAGTFDRYSDIKVCDTPQILLDVGCEQLPMLYSQSHLRNALRNKTPKNPHFHGLTPTQIKQVPNLLKEPAMIFDSISPVEKASRSLVVVLNATDNDNAPLLVAIMPNGKGMYEMEHIDSNFITSIYGKDNGFENYINKVCNSDNLLFWDKNKSQELFSVLGLQLPKGLNNLDYNIIIHQSHNIVKEFEQENIYEAMLKRLNEMDPEEIGSEAEDCEFEL